MQFGWSSKGGFVPFPEQRRNSKYLQEVLWQSDLIRPDKANGEQISTPRICSLRFGFRSFATAPPSLLLKSEPLVTKAVRGMRFYVAQHAGIRRQ